MGNGLNGFARKRASSSRSDSFWTWGGGHTMIDFFFIWHFRPKEPIAYTVVIESHALRSRVSKEWFAWRKKRAQVTRGLTADNEIRDTQKCEQEDWAAVSGSERIAPYRLDQSRVDAYTTGLSQTSILYLVTSAAARTAPNGVKERSSFCIVFRSLNPTSSHRMFSMGYRRANSTQGNTNFQKRTFLANNFGITTRMP